MKKDNLLRSNLPETDVDYVGKTLRPYLDAAAADIKPGIAYRLAEVRRAAIQSLEAQSASSSFQSGGALVMSGSGWRQTMLDWRFWAVGLVAAALVSGYGYQQWQENKLAHDAADVDVQLLADDVPVDALLDNGFQHYLRGEGQ